MNACMTMSKYLCNENEPSFIFVCMKKQGLLFFSNFLEGKGSLVME